MRELNDNEKRILSNLLDELLDDDGKSVAWLGVTHGLSGRDMTAEEYNLILDILCDCLEED